MKQPRRAEFLEQMEQAVPWNELCALAEPILRSLANGRTPGDIERMLRIYFLQQWFELSDSFAEEMLRESPLMRRFARIEADAEPFPDEHTIADFRSLLEEHCIGEDIRARLNQHFHEKGLNVSAGEFLDTALVHSVISARNGKPDAG